MELGEFVRETILQIIRGVEAAQAETGAAVVNPVTQSFVRAGIGGRLVDARAGAIIEEVEFDVAVTLLQGSGKKASVGVLSGVFGVAAQASREASNSTATRVRFKVPIRLPPGNELQARRPAKLSEAARRTRGEDDI